MSHVWTIGFQVVNFLVLAFLLHRYLWKPVRATIDQRKKEIDEAAAGVEARNKAAVESRVAYEAEVKAADHERARLLAGTAVALANDRDKVLTEARAIAAAELEVAREKLAEERRNAAGSLTDAALDLALRVARKLLGDARDAAVGAAFLDRLCDRLDALSAAERTSLCDGLEPGSALQVATAPALDDAAKGRLQTRLATYFGAALKLDFVVDDALIAGAELRFPHARLGHSFQHGLIAARAALAAHAEVRAAHPELIAHDEIVDQ